MEKARLSVPSAIAQVERKYFNRLCGRLINCATKTNEKDPLKRRYLNIPETIQNKVSPEILKAIELKMAGPDYNAIIDLFRRVVLNKNTKGLSSKEAMIIRAIHAECLLKHSKPVSVVMTVMPAR